MPINMNCPSCDKTLSAPDSAVGKKAKCPSCGQLMTVPEVVHEAEPVGVGGQDHQPRPGQTSDLSSAGAEGQSRQPCPKCGELIVAGAAKCRFCNAIFDPELKLMEAGRPGRGSEDLRQIATYQRGVIFCILAQILAYAAIVISSTWTFGGGPWLSAFDRRYREPCLCDSPCNKDLLHRNGRSPGNLDARSRACRLSILLSINQAATKKLTEHGIKVGFFGANMSQF